jgi:hypothetical protein
MIIPAPASMQENPHSASIDPMLGARLEFPRSCEHRFVRRVQSSGMERRIV